MTSKDDFVKAFQEWDGSGVGLLTEKSAMAALKEMNLPFTAQELAQHVAVGKQVTGDANGKIKLNDFATYMSFEVVKKGAAQPAQPQQQQQQQQQQPQQQQQQQQDDNPFAVFGFDTNGNSANNNNNNGNYNNNQKKDMVGVIQKKPGIKVNVNNNNGNQQKGYQVAVTPVQGKDEQKQAPVDMRDAKSPTRANDNELPDWFGHSLTSPVHGQGAMPQQDAWDMFGFDSPNSTTKSQSNSQQPQGNNANNYISSGLKTPATPNIHYSPETPANQKRAQTPNSGLIAPPRQGNRSKSPKSKTRPSSPDKNDAADPFSQFSFGQANASMEADAAQKSNSNNNNSNNNNNNANDYQSPSGSASPNDSSKKEKKKKRKAKKSYEKEADDEVEEAPKKEKKKEEKKKPKKHKTDAIAQMKRGTAMLKYGRHGFPHFRRFQLSRDNQRLLWYSRKKSLAETHIQIKDIKDVLEGQQTEVFKQCTQRTLKKASFSIIYGAKLKTLDVVAKSQEEAQLWTKGLKGLMKANKVGKLHKVVQILVDVPYVDITKPKGKEPTRDPNSKQQFSAELIQTIEHTLRESKKTFEVILKLSDSKHVLKSPEYENVSTLVSELEQRLNEVETGLNQKNVDFIELKRDVWVLKVDVTVLEEKLRVLAKPNSAMFL